MSAGAPRGGQNFAEFRAMPTICAMSRFRAVRIGPHAVVAMVMSHHHNNRCGGDGLYGIYEAADNSVNALTAAHGAAYDTDSDSGVRLKPLQFKLLQSHRRKSVQQAVE
jgi:hypothetical protein